MSPGWCFNSVKLQIVFKSDLLFSPISKTVGIFFKKAHLFTNFHANVIFSTLVALLSTFPLKFTQILCSMLQYRPIKVHIPPLLVTYETIWPAQPLLTPLCLPSWRHQVTNYICQYLSLSSLQNTSLHCVFKNSFIHCFYLTILLYHGKKILLLVPIL